MWKGKVIFMKKLIRKTLAGICSATLIIAGLTGMTACGNKTSDSGQTDVDYKYASYVYDDNAPQYYMSDSAAAAETGYYYIAGAAGVSDNNNKYIYYYDMIKQTALPLCFKTDCDHNTESCEAYITDNMCLRGKIWYHNQRIYMIERTTEKDILVSYDKTMKDKKEEKTLSIDGCLVNGNTNNACISNGKLYYMLSGDNTLMLCSVSLSDDSQAHIIKTYESTYNYFELIVLYAIGDKVYINWRSGISAGENIYYLEVLDINSENVQKLYNMNEQYPDIADSIINWNTEVSFDENNNMYFPCADENNYIIRKLNLDSGEIKDIFILDIEGTTEDLTQENKEIKNNEFVEFKESGDENYISFYGYDGKYLYIYKGVNIGKLAEKSQEERLADYDNYLYIINIDGNIEDIITLNKTADNASANIVLDYKGGDERCMLVTTSRPDVAGIELSQEERDKIGAINKEAAKKRFSGDRVCVSAVLDKSQIGSGSIKLQQITPE